MPVTIHPDLKALITPLTDEEFAQLEANLVTEGCRDALVIWQEEGILLDGHHRYEICERRGLPYATIAISLPDMDAAKAWMITNQLGRRNLTPEQQSYLRGKQYEAQKQEAHRPENNGTKVVPLRTDEKLAAEHHVSRQTIRRDAAFATAVDTVAAVAPDARQALLARDTKISREGVVQLAELARVDSAAAEVALTDMQAAPTAKEAREVLARHVGTGQAQSHEGETSPPPALVTEMEAPVPAVAVVVPAPPLLVAEMAAAEMAADEGRPPRPTSGNYEWYTPAWLVTLCCRGLGGTIDSDPASSDLAQQTVGATVYYTLADDGLSHPWYGHILLNPPYAAQDIEPWLGKLDHELAVGHTTEAILIVNAATEVDWFQFIGPRAQRICFPDGRIDFVPANAADASANCYASAILYFGPNVARFRDVFRAIGMVVIPECAKDSGPQLTFADVPDRAAGTADPAAQTTQPSTGMLHDQLVAALQGHPTGLTTAELAKGLGVRTTDVRFALKRPLTQGLVRYNDATKVYRLVAQEA
jgi:hypothetical protein